MKYCYKCGKPFTERFCPQCLTELHTTKPNDKTDKSEIKKSIVHNIFSK